MPETMRIYADLQAAPDAVPPRTTVPFELEATPAPSLEEGLSPEAKMAVEGELETHQIQRWTARIDSLPLSGEPGGYALLHLRIPGEALPAGTSTLWAGAGEHWQSQGVNPVELEDQTLLVELELELDKAGQWAGAVEILSLVSTVPVMFADTDIVEMSGCAGLPPMRHILWRVSAQQGLGYSRLSAADTEWSEFDGRRTLLFIHGTGLNAKKTLDYMEASSEGLVSRLVRAYGGRMLAFNHSTVFNTVEENIAALLALIPEQNPVTGAPMRLSLDIAAVSRGGLVARYLVEGHGPATGTGISVRNLVFIGTPNDGTYSAVSANTGCVLGVRCICNQGEPELSGPPLGDPLVKGELGVGQPGAKNQQPYSPLLNAMNRMDEGAAPLRALQPELRYYAISSTIWLPEEHSKRECVDKMFGTLPNDLVVPVASTFEPEVRPASRFDGFLPIPLGQRLHFGPEDFVTHVDYINQPRVHAQLLEWLPGDAGLV
ncbi:MAG: hypothetical protein H6741_26885 [Alphaproteobacteria bacterium]|nr:hypothetical protein [Alphaproteobacteria bacterium]MCB9796337.1 hypothetical protein [Alphaproteobacteria bacterium]